VAEADLMLVDRKLEAEFSFTAPSPVNRPSFAIASALPYLVKNARPNTTIVRAGNAVDSFRIVSVGAVATHHVLDVHSRQIVAIHLPGDCIALQDLFADRVRHTVVAVNPVSYLELSIQSVRDLLKRNGNLSQALLAETTTELSTTQQWLISNGRRSAKVKVAYFLCEFVSRLRRETIGDGDRFALPLTQEQLSDCLGLTSVHVNRVLRALENEKLIERNNRSYRILDWKALADLGGFDKAYMG